MNSFGKVSEMPFQPVWRPLPKSSFTGISKTSNRLTQSSLQGNFSHPRFNLKTAAFPPCLFPVSFFPPSLPNWTYSIWNNSRWWLRSDWTISFRRCRMFFWFIFSQILSKIFLFFIRKAGVVEGFPYFELLKLQWEVLLVRSWRSRCKTECPIVRTAMQQWERCLVRTCSPNLQTPKIA